MMNFDDLRRAAKTAPDEADRAKLVALVHEWESMVSAFRGIKGMVVGDKQPNWTDDWATTKSRIKIADACDEFLQR